MPQRKTARAPNPLPAARLAPIPRRHLAIAFDSFTQAAVSLERCYVQLQGDVARLQKELEVTNSNLKRSLAENVCIRSYLHSILEDLPCGVLVFSQEGMVRIVNPEAVRLLGLSSPAALQTFQHLPDSLRALLAAEESDAGGQIWTTENAGRTRLVSVARAALSGEDGTETIFILRDVTQETALAREREAAERTQALAEMATVLAHEIRNPLGSLELFAGLLADASVDHPEIRSWVDHLQAGLRGLSATVNNVLQFHSQPSPQLALTNIARLLRETVEFLQPLARQQGKHVEYVPNGASPTIPADPRRLQQVFFNLALNAFRSMPAGGHLRTRLHPSGPNVQIDFEDEGTGIAIEHLNHIFEPGFTTHPGSPGLGLAVCRKVVEQHGGGIQVRSYHGAGTTFTVVLPLAGASA